MEFLDLSVKLLMLLTIVFTPVYCVYKSYSYLKLYLISASLISLAIISGAYWPHFYTGMRLDLLGYDPFGFSECERLKKVAPEMRGIATQLYWSNMGVGWPLKALIWMVILLPYPSIVWLFKFSYKKLMNKFCAKNT
ncbi:hypothetical protein [Pseudoalteromonas sp. MTN2-4]|uniref:hypothetical protein n=1 Tax=Pseudoalteromonas sp. MTN2-4 TaxID=3056555 RepID=UPI0036F29087